MPTSLFPNDVMLMDKVMEISLPEKTIQKFNMCRLQKQLYFITDILDSRQKGFHPTLMSPDYVRHDREKFPSVQVPKPYWKIWDNILRSIYASIRVSGFHTGVLFRKDQAMWLQKEDCSLYYIALPTTPTNVLN